MKCQIEEGIFTECDRVVIEIYQITERVPVIDVMATEAISG